MASVLCSSASIQERLRYLRHYFGRYPQFPHFNDLHFAILESVEISQLR